MKVILGIIIYSVLIAETSMAFGITQEVWAAPTEEEFRQSAPDDEEGSWWDNVTGAIAGALAPIRWVFNTIATLFLFIGYQVEGIPTLINTLIISPIGGAIIWTIVGRIRGSS